MKKTAQREIEVWGDWDFLAGIRKVGVLFSSVARGKEIFSFQYDKEWLSTTPAPSLDPALGFYGGQQYPSPSEKNFGVFLDSSPDRWGRMLMDRREALRAKEERRPQRSLFESDYLLGVYDGHRIGGLRFRPEPNGPFLSDDKELASPPFSALPELEQASLALERPSADSDPRYGRWLKMLVAPGSSLGGARPKASVLGTRGELWIAKFPSGHDRFDVGAWEAAASELAKRAGVLVPPFEARSFRNRHRTFLTRRFDRISVNKRRHFASALTLLQRSDGDNSSTGASYLEFVEFMRRASANPARDLEELWRRVVFFICISNTDDHLRNHGFILEPDGWSLAPAFDINPNPQGDGLTLNISETDNSQELDLARSVRKHFRVSEKRAEAIIRDVVQAVRSWNKVADSLKISKEEQARMAPAFRLPGVASYSRRIGGR